MNTRQAIRKLFFVTVWMVIGGGMLTLLIAAIGKKNRESCSDYSITIHSAGDKLFVDQNDIRQVLMTITNGKIKGQPTAAIDLPKLEQSLETNSWIRDAELFFDNKDLLHVSIYEREPVARIFTVAGDTYYIDKDGIKMPLSQKLSARVPVITGFPVSKLVTARDSMLLRDCRTIAQLVLHDPFWMSQVSAIDINSDREFEMIPTIGNHIVRLGNGENLEQKFRRLMIFYQQVISKTGFNQYKLLDVRFAGQVVALKQADASKVDSVQLRHNVEKLLKENTDDPGDSLTVPGTSLPAGRQGEKGLKEQGEKEKKGQRAQRYKGKKEREKK